MDNERLNRTPAKDARSEVANVDACGPSVEERRRIALEGDTHGKNKWAILFTVLVMTFMSTLDSSIVNVALPVMQKALAVSLSDIQWVSTIYLVAICASMLIFGRLGDMFGKVWLFQAGVALFAIGSLLCGLSHAFAMLLVSRCVQGIGAAAAMANNMGIITESFPVKERGRALGLLASFVALGMMCGPVLGGVIVSSLPWEYIFLINVPVGVTCFVAGFKTLPHVRPDRRGIKFDLPGACALVPALVLLLCSITFMGEGASLKITGMLLAGLLLMALFVRIELHAEQPLARLSVFSSLTFNINVLATLISFIAIGASEIILPFYFQDAHGFSPSLSGFLFAVIPLVNIVVGPLSGSLSDRIGSHIPTCVGLFIYSLGLAAVGFLNEDSSLPVIIAAVALMSLGTSTFQSPNNSLFMSAAPLDALGFVGSLSGLSQNMGMALGISGGMAILYGKMGEAAGRPVAGYVAGRPDIFFYGYRWALMSVAALVAVGFVLCLVRARRTRR